MRQHAGFTASLATQYSELRLGEGGQPDLEEWSVEKHTEERPTDAFGILNFQGGSHSYRAKVRVREGQKGHTSTPHSSELLIANGNSEAPVITSVIYLMTDLVSKSGIILIITSQF